MNNFCVYLKRTELLLFFGSTLRAKNRSRRRSLKNNTSSKNGARKVSRKSPRCQQGGLNEHTLCSNQKFVFKSVVNTPVYTVQLRSNILLPSWKLKHRRTGRQGAKSHNWQCALMKIQKNIQLLYQTLWSKVYFVAFTKKNEFLKE